MHGRPWIVTESGVNAFAEIVERLAASASKGSHPLLGQGCGDLAVVPNDTDEAWKYIVCEFEHGLLALGLAKSELGPVTAAFESAYSARFKHKHGVCAEFSLDIYLTLRYQVLVLGALTAKMYALSGSGDWLCSAKKAVSIKPVEAFERARDSFGYVSCAASGELRRRLNPTGNAALDQVILEIEKPCPLC